METPNNPCCLFAPRSTTTPNEASQPSVKPGNTAKEHAAITLPNEKQKPWSVFGDVYWI